MALVQIEIEYKKLMARFKKPLDKDTLKVCQKWDKAAQRLASKDTSAKEKEELPNKLKDVMKKLKKAIKEDIETRLDVFKKKQKKKEAGFDENAEARTHVSIVQGLKIIERKAQEHTDRGGKEPPPPKMPEFHFGADYKSLIVRHDGTLSPSVVGALDKLDENSELKKVMELFKLSREALEKQTIPLAAEASQAKDPKEKARLTLFVKELTEFRKNMKQIETKIFLLQRLKG